MRKTESSIQIFHELMACKVREILLVSSPYDAFILEEDGSLAVRIINEYHGLNLSQPPRIKRVSSAREALESIRKRRYDLVITMPHVDDMHACSLGQEIKKIDEDLPVVLLAHSLRSVSDEPERFFCEGIDRFFFWSADTSLLLAIVKNIEDHLNAARDTRKAEVRVIILVEDSPISLSYILPLLYSEVVKQTQAVLAESLNHEHRLLKMRARPKILLAQSCEEAVALYEEFKPWVYAVISDGRFPCQGIHDNRAGLRLLKKVREEVSDLPLLLMSSETSLKEQALAIPAVFVDKNSDSLAEGVHHFFMNQLGFGDFVFRKPDGTVTGWAGNFRTFEENIATIPAKSLFYHASRNHFSNWLMARSEVEYATRLRRLRVDEFKSTAELRSYLLECVHDLRRRRQRGVIVQYSANDFDADVMDFIKIGKGALGGKARGLAFMAHQLAEAENQGQGGVMPIRFPPTMVVASDGFDSFVEENRLRPPGENEEDREIALRFLAARMPAWLLEDLKGYLSQVTGPLSIRSSSLLEDAQYKPYAGLYSTYMLPNNHKNFAVRLDHFVAAVKLVFASTWFAGPRAFTRRTWSQRSGKDRMAVIVQKMVGDVHGDYFYPSVSGVAQSHNFYPVSYMKPEEGIAHIALGLGKTVVEGEKSLRISPRYPKIMPHFSTVDDILDNGQRFFYAMKMKGYPRRIGYDPLGNLVRREVSRASREFPVKMLTSTYFPEEHRIRDGIHPGGVKVVTFAQILKYRLIPLAETIVALLEIGRGGMGCPVEIEFAVNLKADPEKSEFYFLQMRPMVSDGKEIEVDISDEERKRAIAVSSQALGHGRYAEMRDIIYVKRDAFDPARTREIATDISRFNQRLLIEDRTYLLAGPGRWGSADHWLGIPVKWQDISAVGAFIELRNDKMKADPSQGTHFFHNITSMGIPYMTVTEGEDRLDWRWLADQEAVQEGRFLRHVRTARPFLIKIDGNASEGIILPGDVS